MKTSFFNFPVYAVPDAESVLSKLAGKNERKILIAVNSEQWEQDEIFLNRIFNAAGVDLPKDGLILASNSSEIKPSLTQIAGVHDVLYVFLFGVAPSEVGIQANFPLNAPISWNKRFFFVSAALKEVEQSTELKRPLWDFLRAEFLKK